MIGQTIGKYRFVEQLGREGQTTIYKAIDETLGREVAVKVLNPQQADREVMKHFQAEATTLARLNHPDIVGIHEVHQTESDLLLVMELVRGETLDQLAARTGPLPPERAAYLVAQVLGALVHAHAANVVHRNLKPSNVTVTEQGGIKVHDFGVSRVAADDQVTSDGFTLGSPAYLAPEQLLGKAVDGRADVYSAGVIFYNLLTGRLPFAASTPLEMVQRQLSGEPTPAATYRPELPGWCQAILNRALARSPDDRFPTAEAFRSTLLAAISEATESTGVFSAVRAQAAALDPDRTMAVPASAAAAAQSLPPAPLTLPQVPQAEPVTVAAWSQPLVATPAGLQMGPAQATPPVATAPVVAARAAAASVPAAPPAVSPKKTQFAVIGALAAAVVLVVAVIAMVVLRKPTEVPVEAPPAATEPAPVQPAPEQPAASASAPAAPSASASGTATAPAPARGAAPATPAPETTAPPPVAAPVHSPPAVPAASSPTLDTTPLSFNAKAIVSDGDKRRERDAVVLVADGTVSVNEKGSKGKPIYALPITGLIGLTYSKSKNPLWSTPDGPAEAMRVEGGALGFLKGGGDRNWVGLRTKDSLLVLRLDEDQVDSVTTGLEERTGLTLERLAERKQ